MQSDHIYHFHKVFPDPSTFLTHPHFEVLFFLLKSFNNNLHFPKSSPVYPYSLLTQISDHYLQALQDSFRAAQILLDAQASFGPLLTYQGRFLEETVPSLSR